MKKNIIKVIIRELVQVKCGVILINKGLEREEGEENWIVEWIGRVWPLESQEKRILLLLYCYVQICSSLFICYFQFPTQIHSEILFSYSFIYYCVIIIIKYLYNWYQILDLGFKPVTRSSGAMEERVDGLKKWMMDHSQMLETILKRLNDMMMHLPQHDHST